jgi:hypothetical protein
VAPDARKSMFERGRTDQQRVLVDVLVGSVRQEDIELPPFALISVAPRPIPPRRE